MTDILNHFFVPSPDAVESAVGDETVILHLVNGTYYGLDAIGTKMWGLIKQGVSSPDICLLFAQNYGVELEKIENDARRFLTDLQAQGILIDG